MKTEIVYLPIADIHPYENNPRQNDDAVDKVAESINQFGFKVPIVIDKNGVIVTGHTRYKAAKKLRLKEVPCIKADDLSPEQVKAFRIVDNKVAEYSEWDFEKLRQEIDALSEIDFNLDEFDLNLESAADSMIEGINEIDGSLEGERDEEKAVSLVYIPLPRNHIQRWNSYKRKNGTDDIVAYIIKLIQKEN